MPSVWGEKLKIWTRANGRGGGKKALSPAAFELFFFLLQFSHSIQTLRVCVFSSQKNDFSVCELFSPDVNLWSQELG